MSPDVVFGTPKCPGPHWGAHSAPPDLLAALRRPTCKGRQRSKKRQKEREKEVGAKKERA